MLGLGTGYALLALPSAYLPLAVLLVLAGTLLAPASVICSTLLDDVAPSGTVTEAYAVMVTGIVAGIAVGQALGGSIIESASYDTAALSKNLKSVGRGSRVGRQQPPLGVFP